MQLLSAATRFGLVTLLCGAALCLCAVAGASLGDERVLAERYAPVVRLVEQM
jgi:hypothetical protein